SSKPPVSKRSKRCDDSNTELVSINGCFFDDAFRERFKKAWQQRESIAGHNYELKQDPFQLAVLQNFLQEDVNRANATKRLEAEFSTVDWKRKQMDLYEFYQTNDLCSLDRDYLQAFYIVLKEQMMPLVEELTGIQLTHVSASCSMYNAGDYLLVHDDLLSDRRIAYVFYLSPWDCHRQWQAKDGGALELFKADGNQLPVFPVTDKIYPQNNQLVLFRVCEKSFHQVGEVTTFEYPRLTINGWFHGPAIGGATSNATQAPSIIIDTHYMSPRKIDVDLAEWINDVYLVDEVKQNVQKKVEMFSEVSLEQFLLVPRFATLLESLTAAANLEWRIKGPAHLRKYEVLNFKSLPEGSPLAEMYDLFTSRTMFRLLYDYTELDLYGKKAKSPKCAIELQRWERGCYTVLGDSSTYADSTLDITFYLNAQENVGVITYLVPEGDQKEQEQQSAWRQNDAQPSSSSSASPYAECYDEDPVLLTLLPKDNVLNVVYRAEGTTKFTKYVSHNTHLEKADSNGHAYTYILLSSRKVHVSSIKAYQVLSSWMLQEYKLKAILGSRDAQQTLMGRQLRLNSAPLQAQYEVLITVLNPRPELQKVHWNARAAAENYIEPFLNELSGITNFTIKTQWIYQVGLEGGGAQPKQIPDDSKLGRHYALAEDSLPHIITSLEKKLGTQITDNPCIHLVVYVPPCAQAPLRIYRKDGQRASALSSNVEAFTSAKWGGIVFANPSEATCVRYMETEQFSDVYIHAQDVMPVLLYQLRKIFDLENNTPLLDATMVPYSTIEPRAWEVDTFIRTNTIYLVHSATTTLQSLIQLLGGIEYIVINDEVGAAIHNAYERIVEAKEKLRAGKLEQAARLAREAYTSAERAFFDPSMLALLYFPDEQKYAIYIPLFLPIMIPVCFTLRVSAMDKEHEVLLNAFVIAKKRYRVFYNAGILVWEDESSKKAKTTVPITDVLSVAVSKLPHANGKQWMKRSKAAAPPPPSTPPAAAIARNEAHGSLDSDRIPVLSGSTTTNTLATTTISNNIPHNHSNRGSLNDLSDDDHRESSNEYFDASIQAGNFHYLIIHYAALVCLKTNRWRVKSVALHNSEHRLVELWYNRLSSDLRDQNRPKNLLLFLNPYGGKKNALALYERFAKPLFRLAEVDINLIITQRAQQIFDIVTSKSIVLENYDGLVCCGGDGTFAELFNGLVTRTMIDQGIDINHPSHLPKTNIPIGVIPAGSTDTVACCLNGTTDIKTSIIHIILGQHSGLDISAVYNGAKDDEGSPSKRPQLLKLFASALSYGYLGDIAYDSEKYRWMGPKRYDYSGFKKFLANRGYNAEIVVHLDRGGKQDPNDGVRCLDKCSRCKKAQYGRENGDVGRASFDGDDIEPLVVRGKFLMVSGANISCSCERSPQGFSPFCHLGDGQLDLVLVRHTSMFNNLRLLLTMTSKTKKLSELPFVEIYRTKEFRFTAKGQTERQNGSEIAPAISSQAGRRSKWNCDGEVLLETNIIVE
uniref:Uncharacterized protein n=1 Tax=Anopheles epiroticus TaxID=199890 RepID=A0A182NZD5_9DIPT